MGEVEINDAKSFMKINQNPFQNKLVIEFNQIEQNAAIQICDYLGRIVYQSKISNKLVELNTSEWLNGIYFIELISDADRKYFKLIKN
ncbi:MAG: T9SS type A sorting domain-containing protein [Bacteroidetes bacterium]|nr:T9SS type A sorting domain-containing protein [Bacteroidota bacterium]